MITQFWIMIGLRFKDNWHSPLEIYLIFEAAISVVTVKKRRWTVPSVILSFISIVSYNTGAVIINFNTGKYSNNSIDNNHFGWFKL